MARSKPNKLFDSCITLAATAALPHAVLMNDSALSE